jgi:hypothetical protein
MAPGHYNFGNNAPLVLENQGFRLGVLAFSALDSSL